MPDVFQYTDYHAYLRDYHAERKALNPSYSFEILARKAGFRTRGFLHNVAVGRKNLSADSATRVAQAVTDSPRAALFFELLVSFGNARSARTRESLFLQLSAFKSGKTGAARIRELHRDQFEFYATWYHAAVRSLIDMYPFTHDYKWLAASLRPTITARQAEQSVELLERLGLIVRDARSRCHATDRSVRPAPTIEALAMRRLHREQGRLALESLDGVAVEKRNVTGLTLGISQATYESICRETRDFQERLLALAEQDKGADRVYQYNFQIFPLSDTRGKGPRP